MAMYLLRKLYNGIIYLFTGILAVGTFYVAAAIVLAVFFITQMTVMPVVSQWIPESTDIRLLILGWLACSTVCLYGFGTVAARGVNVVFGLLDSFVQSVSANEPAAA